MQLKPEHIEYRKEIGKLGTRPVIELKTTGGLFLVTAPKENGSGVEILSTGSHRAVSRFLAKKKYEDLKIQALEKSEDIDVSYFAHLIPQYEALTKLLNSRGE